MSERVGWFLREGGRGLVVGPKYEDNEGGGGLLFESRRRRNNLSSFYYARGHDICSGWHRLDRANRAGGGAGRVLIFCIGSYMGLVLFGFLFRRLKVSSDICCSSSNFKISRSYKFLPVPPLCEWGLSVEFGVSTDSVKGSGMDFMSCDLLA